MGKRGLATRIIATKNNQVLYGRNLPVRDDKGNILPKVGQPVLWLPNMNLSIDHTDLPNHNEFELSVVTYQMIAGRKTKKLTAVNASDWSLCTDRFKLTNTLPNCAVPQKVNFLFDCLDPYGEKGVSIEITYRDGQYQILNGGDGEVAKQFNFAPKDTEDCDGCPNPNYSCWDYACGLAWEINRYNSTDKEIEQVGMVNKGDSVYFPIKAAAIPYGRLIHKVCITPSSTECKNCNVLDGLESLTITKSKDNNGANLAEPVVTVIPLTQFTVDDTTETELMLHEIQEYLTYELNKIGVYVNIGGGMGTCCDYEIEVTGCMDLAVLTTSTGDLTFETEDPWIDVPVESFCKSCDETNPNYAPKCLVRLYTESLEARCSCLGLPEHNYNSLNFYKEIIDVHALEGFRQDKFVVHYVQRQKFPFNMGHTFIQLIASRQSIGGPGADMHEGGGFYGDYPQQMNNHKFWDARFNIDCDTSYCALNIVAFKGDKGWPVTNYAPTTSEAESIFLIPTSDVATFDSIKPIFDYFASTNKCNNIEWKCFSAVIATSVTISGASTDFIGELETVQLSTATLPAGAPNTGTWVSSDPSVATVSSTGLVTTLTSGTTTITFTSSTDTLVTDTRVVTVV